jgi:endonuclease/exonuclease/phosphatase family metal-dependent hydrolase
MTRNLYHGGDIAPVLAVGFSDLELLTETAAGVWAEVQGNDFHERVAALVDEIEATNPDIVGLQELAEFVTFALNPATGSYVETGGIDFEAILEEELIIRGLPYSFLAVQPSTVVRVPVAGMGMGGTFIPTQLVQLAVRDGVLARNDLMVEGVSQANYGAVVPLGTDPFGSPIQMKRGWIRVDANVGGVPYHFISTHMEIQPFAPYQMLQAEELLTEVVADLDGVTILMGDFNSDAAGSEGDESWTPTYQMVRDAGFTDLWAMTHPGRAFPGLTCCQASNLLNPVPTFYERIDFIFLRSDALRGPKGHIPGVASVRLVGDDPGSKTVPSGLWPSDHAGLVADLFWAPGG